MLVCDVLTLWEWYACLWCADPVGVVEEAPKLKHRFRHYYFNRSRTCFLCKQKVLSQGSACQVCRYICHRQCENQVSVYL
ncbi:hypothetical protein KUTeg_002566 [Tegillarca granosa]|uniref:Phorbol-ester/DAG-type domain-containing protein n=1 Tax=Tegillarca granosa TaxID=220873 RepID=A0ABQ9FUP8_TEGGR|nr:hypothetical protein KUTeg_002566 [Tegillarca granosa]